MMAIVECLPKKCHTNNVNYLTSLRKSQIFVTITKAKFRGWLLQIYYLSIGMSLFSHWTYSITGRLGLYLRLTFRQRGFRWNAKYSWKPLHWVQLLTAMDRFNLVLTLPWTFAHLPLPGSGGWGSGVQACTLAWRSLAFLNEENKKNIDSWSQSTTWKKVIQIWKNDIRCH